MNSAKRKMVIYFVSSALLKSKIQCHATDKMRTHYKNKRRFFLTLVKEDGELSKWTCGVAYVTIHEIW